MNEPAARIVSESEPDQLKLAVGKAEEEVGARLRHQRLKRQIALEDAARALKLVPATLADIERGELDRHPTLYRRGYLRNYARFLGLDPEPLLAMVEQPEASTLRAVLPRRRRAPKLDRLLKIATYVIVTTLIVPPLVLIYVQGGLRFMDRQVAVVADNETILPGTTDTRNTNRLARVLALDESDNHALGGPVTASALPLASIRPVRDLVGPETTPTSAAAALEAEADGRSLLVVDLVEDSWLEIYAADGQRLVYDLLRAGEQRRFSAEAPFRLLLGRASAVNLQLDGQPVRYEGQERGDVASLELLADGEVRR